MLVSSRRVTSASALTHCAISLVMTTLPNPLSHLFFLWVVPSLLRKLRTHLTELQLCLWQFNISSTSHQATSVTACTLTVRLQRERNEMLLLEAFTQRRWRMEKKKKESRWEEEERGGRRGLHAINHYFPSLLYARICYGAYGKRCRETSPALTVLHKQED